MPRQNFQLISQPDNKTVTRSVWTVKNDLICNKSPPPPLHDPPTHIWSKLQATTVGYSVVMILKCVTKITILPGLWYLKVSPGVLWRIEIHWIYEEWVQPMNSKLFIYSCNLTFGWQVITEGQPRGFFVVIVCLWAIKLDAQIFNQCLVH